MTDTKIRVTRDGKVFQGDKEIGKIVKGHGESIYSALTGSTGPVEYTAYSLAGEALITCDRRQRAVSILEEYAKGNRVEGIKRQTFYGTTFITASLIWEGTTLGIYCDQDAACSQWGVHFIWNRGAIIPRYSTMVGTGGYALKNADMIKIVNDAVIEWLKGGN
jgi:hypothetical protein